MTEMPFLRSDMENSQAGQKASFSAELTFIGCMRLKLQSLYIEWGPHAT
jgi:hypothetical protein